MQITVLPYDFSVCRIADTQDADLTKPFVFLSGTDQEISLVCPTAYAPEQTLLREDGWRGFRVEGVLDFSLVGILAKISGCLAKAGIPIFAVSTYNTDYVLTRTADFARALDILSAEGYAVARL